MRGHIRKRGSTWTIVLDVGRDPATGNRSRKWHGGFKTKRDAQRALTEMLGQIDKGTYVQPKKLTLGEYLVSEWLPALKTSIRPSTWDSYERNLASHVIPRIGHVYLQQLSPASLNSVYAGLLVSGRLDGKGGLSPRSVNYIHTMLHRALGDAVRWRYVGRNVAGEANPPRARAATPEMSTWTAEELGAFLAQVREERLFPVFLFAATSGMRRGEVLGLRWRDVDLEQGRAAVRQTLVAIRHALHFSEPKTARGKRSVALDSHTVQILRAHRASQAQEKLAAGPLYETNDLVFADELGRPLHPESVAKVFERRVARSALPRIRFHDLRHTYATLALAAGVHPKIVSERLGHSGIAITLDTYSHAIPAMESSAAETVAALIFGGPTA